MTTSPTPNAVPERKTSNPHRGGTQAYIATEHYNEGWNDCLAALSQRADVPADRAALAIELEALARDAEMSLTEESLRLLDRAAASLRLAAAPEAPPQQGSV